MKIVIADPLPASAGELLRSEGWTVIDSKGLPPGGLDFAVSDADGLIVRSATKVSSNLIDQAPRLRVIARAGTGVDNVDLAAASARGILVLNAPGANSISVAEHTVALMLAAARSIPLADAQMKAGNWEKKSHRGVELRGKTLGIIGLGRIGREVARRAAAFDMTVIAHDPFIVAPITGDTGIPLTSLDELFERADFVTLHLPSTDSTRGLINRKRLKKSKRGIRIINTARGDLIDEPALTEAILSGHVANASLDVFLKEPPADLSLTGLPQVLATPHIAASTVEAQEQVGLEAAASLRDYLCSGIVRNAVNFPSVPTEDMNRLQPYINLADRLGSFLAQLSSGSPIQAIGIRYYGAIAEGNTEMLVGSALVGIFRQILSSSVTLVNAGSIASERGLEVIESRSSRSRNFASVISLKLHTEHGELWAEGALFEPNSPRLVRLDGVEIEVPLDGTLFVIRNNDKPGVIGEVGTILGQNGINIATFALGRHTEGAVGVVRVESTNQPATDSTANARAIDELRQIPAVQKAGIATIP